MAKLQFSHEIVKKAKKQEMVIQVDYDPTDDSIDNPAVWVYQNGALVAEISDLLDKAEGDPLSTMIETIDWRAIFSDERAERMAA